MYCTVRIPAYRILNRSRGQHPSAYQEMMPRWKPMCCPSLLMNDGTLHSEARQRGKSNKQKIIWMQETHWQENWQEINLRRYSKSDPPKRVITAENSTSCFPFFSERLYHVNDVLTKTRINEIYRKENATEEFLRVIKVVRTDHPIAVVNLQAISWWREWW